jgi:putative membrane protein
MTDGGPSESSHLAHERTDLAVERTLLAHERTLMAWVRTATSLISFGFTIYKFFDYLAQNKQTVHQGWFGPREFAMMLIGIGLIALVFAIIEHQHSRAAILALGGQVRRSLAQVMAILVAGLGVFGLLLAWLRQ